MEKSFETEVLTRLAVIESKIDDYKTLKEKTDDALNIGHENSNKIEYVDERVNDLEDSNKWAFRTSIGAIITSVVGIVFLLIKLGMGIN